MNAHWSHDLEGKRAVVTGGAGVICGAIAEFLASEGVSVAVADLNAERAREKAKSISAVGGGSAIGIGCNVLETQSLAEAEKTVRSELGGIDILINGAGGNSPKATTVREFISDDDLGNLDGTFFGLDVGSLRSVFDLNFMGTLLPSLVFGRSMVAGKNGVILNISSMNSFRPLTRIPAYSAAKASINNFTAWLAVHCAKQNVRVNAIAPGFLLTEQNNFLLIDKTTLRLTERGEKIMAATPMGRFGTPQELLGAVRYLVSDMSQFVTGIVLPIDGGFSAYSGV